MTPQKSKRQRLYRRGNASGLQYARQYQCKAFSPISLADKDNPAFIEQHHRQSTANSYRGRYGLDSSSVNSNKESVSCTPNRYLSLEKTIESEISGLSLDQIAILGQLGDDNNERLSRDSETENYKVSTSRITQRRQQRLNRISQIPQNSQTQNLPQSLVSSTWKSNESQRVTKGYSKQPSVSNLHRKANDSAKPNNHSSKTGYSKNKKRKQLPLNHGGNNLQTSFRQCTGTLPSREGSVDSLLGPKGKTNTISSVSKRDIRSLARTAKLWNQDKWKVKKIVDAKKIWKDNGRFETKYRVQ